MVNTDKIISKLDESLHLLIAYIASGKIIAQDDRRILRRKSVALVRLLDGCVLNAFQEESVTISDGEHYKGKYPTDDITEALDKLTEREKENLPF